MLEVSVTAFRNHVPNYLEKVRNGEDIALTSRGKVVVRLMPPGGGSEYAKQQLAALRATSRIGDVVSPIGEDWEADRADS